MLPHCLSPCLCLRVLHCLLKHLPGNLDERLCALKCYQVDTRKIIDLTSQSNLTIEVFKILFWYYKLPGKLAGWHTGSKQIWNVFSRKNK